VKRSIAVALVWATAACLGREARAQEPPEAPAAAPEYTLDGNLLRIVAGGTAAVVDLGCQGRATLRTAGKLLVACGTAGVVQVDVSDPTSPQREGSMQVDGDATGLFVRDGRVWVEISHVDARPVRIDAQTSSAAPTPTTERGAPPERETAVARAVERESPSIMAPPRQANLWELSLETSAFVAIGALGAGVLGSASVAYRFDAPFVVRAEVAPFGIAGPTSASNETSFGPVTSGQTPQNNQGGRTITTAAAHLLAGIDTQFIEVAVGAGSATVNQNTGFFNGVPDTSAFSIAESARIGARDGLSLTLESSVIAANKQFNLGYFVSSLQIPLSRTAMLVVRGGGGDVGFAYGDLGVRVLMRGDGGRGTVALTGFVGGASIMVDLCSSNTLPPFTEACNSSNLGGPSLGGALEWKL
jgi:hypothetical protein